MVPSKRNYYFLASFLYCAVLFCIRVCTSSDLSPDEAEQFYAAQKFQLSYPTQAPLFTWLIYFSSLFTRINFFSINLLKFFLFFLFLVLFYLCIEKLVARELRLSAFLSLVSIELYSHDFNRDLTNTVLLVCLSALTLYLVFRLIENPCMLNYSLLGLSVGLGWLAKYNFAILALGIFLAIVFSKEHRSLLQKPWHLVAFIAFLLLITFPHVYGLSQYEMSSILHALHKSTGKEVKFWSLRQQAQLLSVFVFSIAPALVSLVFFKKEFKEKLITQITAFAFLTTLAIIYIFQMKLFTYHWLACVLFLIPLMLFGNYSQNQSKNKIWVFNAICFSILAYSLGVRCVYNFLPQISGKTIALHVPFAPMVAKIENLYDLESTIFISNNIFILANLKAHNPKIKTLWLEKLGYDNYSSIHQKQKVSEVYKSQIQQLHGKKVIILGKKDTIKGKLPKRFRKIFGNLGQSHQLKDKYLYSNDEHFVWFLWEA